MEECKIVAKTLSPVKLWTADIRDNNRGWVKRVHRISRHRREKEMLLVVIINTAMFHWRKLISVGEIRTIIILNRG